MHIFKCHVSCDQKYDEFLNKPHESHLIAIKIILGLPNASLLNFLYSISNDDISRHDVLNS